MKKSIFAVRRLTLNDIINSEEFQTYQDESIIRYLTHREIIQEWRNFVINLRINLEIPARVYNVIQHEIDGYEAIHEAAGTLNQQIGVTHEKIIKIRITNGIGKTMELSLWTENNRVYFYASPFYYNLLQNDTTGLETIKSNLAAGCTVEVIK